MTILWQYIISTLLGVAASLAAWLLVVHGWKPRLQFSSRISKVESDDETGTWAYRVKLWNPGRRDVVDVSFRAQLRIRGLNPRRPQNWETSHLNVSFGGHLPIVQPRGKQRHARLVRIWVDLGEFCRSVYPEVIRSKAQAGTLSLEDLLAIGSETAVQVIAFGSDSFSGSRRYFASPEYRREHIVQAAFRATSLAVVAK